MVEASQSEKSTVPKVSNLGLQGTNGANFVNSITIFILHTAIREFLDLPWIYEHFYKLMKLYTILEIGCENKLL